MTKRTEEWIYISTPDGEQLIASPTYIRKLMGIDDAAHNIYHRLDKLESQVRILERPLKKAKILELLKDRQPHNYMWLENRVKDANYWTIRELTNELIQEEKLEKFKSGTQTMFRLAE